MRVLVEFQAGTPEPRAAVQSILDSKKIPFVRIDYTFDEADLELKRFVHVDFPEGFDPEEVSRAAVALRAAPEVTTADLEPDASVS